MILRDHAVGKENDQTRLLTLDRTIPAHEPFKDAGPRAFVVGERTGSFAGLREEQQQIADEERSSATVGVGVGNV